MSKDQKHGWATGPKSPLNDVMESKWVKVIEQRVESQEFYELMQHYRWQQAGSQQDVLDAFDAVKRFIKTGDSKKPDPKKCPIADPTTEERN